MKTLQKLTLMAFAIMSAGVANAQTTCTNCTPPSIAQPPHRPDPGCRNCSTAPTFSSSRLADHTTAQPGTPYSTPPTNSSVNSSSVFQQGTFQYACVEQVTRDNVATLIQDRGTATGNGHNDAYQYQRNATSFVDNVMYGSQSGENNFLIQRQDGYDNLARAFQTGNGNIAGQSQGDASSLAYSNNAHVSQTSNDNVSVQYQRGNNNSSDVAQYNQNANWSATAQLGSNNSVTVNQH